MGAGERHERLTSLEPAAAGYDAGTGMSMTQLIDAVDWASTPIGARETWPQSLRTSRDICLASRFPILIWWGPELIMLYNDAYATILGDKHPRAIGARGWDIWPEIWSVIGPMLDQVMTQRKATWSDDQLLIVNRHGYPEEAYFTFSYSPISDESGGVGGIFTAVTETTTRVIGERRLDTLRGLAAGAGESKSVERACVKAAETLAANRHDIPFAALYLRRDARAELVSMVGDPPSSPPAAFDWNAPPRIWSAPALSLPLNIPGEEGAAGLLVAGISPLRPLDAGYHSFFTLVAGHIASAAASAKAYEYERQRAESLAELDRAKTAFFSNVSHEFRTPLTLMLGPLEELLAEGSVMGSGQREQIETAHRNALRLLKLVNTLLDFSRIEAGRIDASYEPTDLSSLTCDLAATFRSAIERAGVRLIVDCPQIGEPLFVDRDMWEKIVLNLLSNALKFTFEGEIEVSIRKAGTRAELKVRDTGTGIPADQLPHIFDRFHRVKGARGRTHEGTGIGLALVQELVKLHGGDIHVESEAGRGATFTVSVPLGRAHLPADHIGARQGSVPTAARADAWLSEAGRWVRPEPSAASDGTGRARVLVADDNADMREYVRRLLSGNYEVEAVADGAEALDAARRATPDLIVTDVMMPHLDGFELLRAVRADARFRNTSVILLSARAGEESKVEGMEAGADDYLVKPFSARELLARVDAHVRLQRARREAELAVRQSEAKFATAFGHSPLALTITSLDEGRLVEVNEGFVRMSGYSRGEAVGRTPEELGLWIDPRARAERFGALRSGKPVPDVEARFRIKNGDELIGMVGSALVEIDGRPCVLTSVTDITDRKRIEDALRESEARFREFADTAPAMLWITDSDDRCTFISRGWLDYTGQTEEEALGLGWLDVIHPDDYDATHAALVAATAKREPFEVDYRIRRADGEYRWAIDSARPRINAAGEFLGYIGSVIDITDRKRAEQSKDEFLATLSHELRTPLTSGFGWVKFLSAEREPQLVETGLHAIQESFINQMKLIDDLLDVSRIAAGKLHLELQSQDLGTVVDAALATVQPAAEAKGIDLRVSGRTVAAVRGDASRLKQIFWNLLSNAIKFTPRGGLVEVELTRRNSVVEMIVRDNGEGIDPAFIPHVFDRFKQADASTTRRHGGLVIGLSIVASLVDAHGGSVRAESAGIGHGATFTVTLPLLEQSSSVNHTAVRVTGTTASLAGGRIVVVDDDAATRRIMMAALEAAGAEVRECSTAEEAFLTVSDWRPHVLVSDLAMPDEDGYSLLRRLREHGHGVPALALTAYVRPEDEARVREAGFHRHVAKPFDPDELVRAVAGVARLT